MTEDDHQQTRADRFSLGQKRPQTDPRPLGRLTALYKLA